MKKIYSLILLLALFAFGLEILNIHLSDKLASDGMVVRKVQDNISVIEEENHVLRTKVLELTAFEIISSKAAVLGFKPAQSYISLKNQTKLSYKR